MKHIDNNFNIPFIKVRKYKYTLYPLYTFLNDSSTIYDVIDSKQKRRVKTAKRKV